jgi:hypothetical protein
MLSVQLLNVVSRAANPVEAMLIDRDVGSARLSAPRAEEYLAKLVEIYSVHVSALLSNSGPAGLALGLGSVGDVNWGRASLALALAPDALYQVKLPLLTSMLLLLNRLSKEGHAGPPLDGSLLSSQWAARQSAFRFALDTLRELAGSDGGLIGATAGFASASQPPIGSHTGFVRCVDASSLRPKSSQSALVQVSLRLIRAALPSSGAQRVAAQTGMLPPPGLQMSPSDSAAWGVSLTTARAGDALLGVLRKLLGDDSAALSFVSSEHD